MGLVELIDVLPHEFAQSDCHGIRRFPVSGDIRQCQACDVTAAASGEVVYVAAPGSAPRGRLSIQMSNPGAAIVRRARAIATDDLHALYYAVGIVHLLILQVLDGAGSDVFVIGGFSTPCDAPIATFARMTGDGTVSRVMPSDMSLFLLRRSTIPDERYLDIIPAGRPLVPIRKSAPYLKAATTGRYTTHRSLGLHCVDSCPIQRPAFVVPMTAAAARGPIPRRSLGALTLVCLKLHISRAPSQYRPATC